MNSLITRKWKVIIWPTVLVLLAAVMPVGAEASVNQAVAAGEKHTVVISSDGTVWTWGENADGQLGDGTKTDSPTPVQSNITDVAAVAAGAKHTVALKTDGTVWAWGENAFGQLGDGTKTNSPTPVQANITNVVSVDAGGKYTVALKDDGTVWAWGDNCNGQLGDGTITNSPTPVQANMTNVAAIAAGENHTIALKEDGTVWAWGDNTHGKLGDGTNTQRTTPVQVQGLTGVSAVSAGEYHTVALKEDGTVWAWGDNWAGQLGDGTKTESFTPVQSNITEVTAVATGENHTVALKEDGTVWVWGDNGFGELGDGTGGLEAPYSTTPVQSNITEVAAVDAGKNYTVALKEDGTVWAWGDNSGGKLGDGTKTDRYTPVRTLGGAVTSAEHPLNETNLNGSTLDVSISFGDNFKSNLSADQFILNNAPAGTTVTNAVYSGGNCVLTLSFDGDFDTDINNFSVTIKGDALDSGQEITTNNSLSIEAIDEPVSVTANQPLEENSLDGTLLSVILENDTFRDSSLDKANFILNNAPAGLSVGSVFYNDSTHCVVTLVYDGTPLTNDIDDFSFTIKAAEMSNNGDASSNRLIISAQPQVLSITTAGLPAATVGMGYSYTLQAVSGSGTYTWSESGLPAGLSLDAATGMISGTPQASGNSQVTFTVTDEDENSAGKTLTLAVNLLVETDKYTVTPVADSSYTTGATGDGIITMTVNSGTSGLKYFTVTVTPVETHSGEECMVFVHFRNDEQLSLNVIVADFDTVGGGKAGFDVRSGDVVMVYIVDDMTNDENFNPTILQ